MLNEYLKKEINFKKMLNYSTIKRSPNPYLESSYTLLNRNFYLCLYE